jgi:hypothetical protein
MFGCLPLDGPHREGGLLAGLRTYLPLSRTTLTQQFFGSAPQISAPCPAASPILRVIVAHRRDARAGRCGCWSTRSWSITYFILCSSSRDCLKTLRSSFNSARASRVYWPCFSAFLLPGGRRNRGHRHASDSAFFRALPVTCRVCPSAFWRRSAGWTTSGRCYDDEFFRPSYSSQACQPRPCLDPEPKGAPRSRAKGCTPLDPQRFSAASERCCNCRRCPQSCYQEKPKRHLK